MSSTNNVRVHNVDEVSDNQRSEYVFILIALLLPTLITWIYFVGMSGQAATIQQGVYAVGKSVQFSLPIIWVFGLRREKFSWLAWGDYRGLKLGWAFGLVIFGLIVAMYWGVFKPLGWFEGPGEQIRRKVVGIGLATRWKYAAVLVFYALGHSFLEEYYWRWFVFRRIQKCRGNTVAILVSSCGFMAHHVVILATYFGWLSPLTYLFSLSVGIGGFFWAWLYGRSGSLIGPWLGHALVDAAIFVIGFDLVRDILQ